MTVEAEMADAAKRADRTARATRKKANGTASPLDEIVWFKDAQLDMSGAYVIKSVIDAAALIALVAASGTGKTFFGLNMGCHVAAGLDWYGLKVNRGVVLYLAPEAGRSVLRRVVAWRQHHGTDDVLLAIRPLPVDLLRPEADTAKILALCAEIAATHGAVVMIVVDTASRSMPGGKESNAEDMTAFISNCDRLRTETGAAVLLVHHHGKDASKGSRGHSSLPAAVDTEITIENHVATVTKARDNVSGASFPFRLQVCELGIDSEGDKITSCVAVADDREGTARKAAKTVTLSPACRLALDALRDAIATGGAVPPASNHIPASTKTVSTSVWRDYAYARTISDGKQNAKRMAFNRAVGQLLAQGIVACWNDHAWIVRPAT